MKQEEEKGYDKEVGMDRSSDRSMVQEGGKEGEGLRDAIDAEGWRACSSWVLMALCEFPFSVQ